MKFHHIESVRQLRAKGRYAQSTRNSGAKASHNSLFYRGVMGGSIASSFDHKTQSNTQSGAEALDAVNLQNLEVLGYGE